MTKLQRLQDLVFDKILFLPANLGESVENPYARFLILLAQVFWFILLAPLTVFVLCMALTVATEIFIKNE